MTGVVEISSVTKTFPGVRALDDVGQALAAEGAEGGTLRLVPWA